MANRYWVGGTGTWNGTNTLNWSASSGGVVGASVPTSADNVFFDANSNVGTTAFTVTMATVTAVCADFDASAVDGVMTLAGTVALDVYGSLSWPVISLFTRSYTGITTFRATTTGKTINATRSFGANVVFDGVGGGWTLTTALTTPSNFQLNNGSLNLGGFTLSAFGINSNNSNARTIAFNGGSITITGSASTSSQTLWNVATATNLTVTGTPTVNVINTSTNSGFTRTFTHGGTAGGSEPNAVNLNIQAGDTGSLVSVQGVFKNLNFTGCSSTLNNNTRIICGNLIIGSGMTLTAGTLQTTFALTSGTQQITSAGKNFDFPINFGATYTTTAASGDGTTATLTFSAGTQCLAVGSTIIVAGVTPAGYNGTYTVTASTNSTVSYLNATTGAQTVAGTIVNGGSTTYTLQDDLNVGTATSRTITLNTGTLNLNNFTLTNFGLWASNNSNTRAIAFGTGNYTNIYNAGSAGVWGMQTATGFTLTGTPTVNITGNQSGAVTRTISHGNTAGATEANSITVNVSAGSDTTTLTGGFLNINFTGFSGTLGLGTRTIYGNLTLPSGLTVTAGVSTTTFGSTSATVRTITTNSNTLDFPITFNGVGGSWQLQDALACGTSTARTMTLTAGTLDLNASNITLFGGFVGTGSTARTIAFGTGQFFLTGTSGTLWSVTGTNLTITGTNPTITANANTSSGERDISHVPTTVAENLAINMNITAGSADFGFGGGIQLVKNINFTGFTGRAGNAGVTSAPQFNIYNNMTLNTGMTLLAGNVAFTFRGSSGTQVLTSNSVTINSPITFGTGTNTTTTYQLADTLTVASDKAITLSSGIFDSNAKPITTGTFSFGSGNTKTLTLTNSYITITGGTSTTGFVGSTTGTSYNFTGTEIVFTTSSAAALAGISTLAPDTIVTMSGTGTLTIGSTNQSITLKTLRNTVQPCTISLLSTANSLNVTNFNLSGTAGNLVTFNSSVAGTARTISKASGTVNAYYLNLQDSTASGGAVWNAYNSTNSGNNTGWNFLTANSGNFLMFFN